jgi:S-adenosylmethionine:tRNA ribosyltransferase-isomerase
MDTAELDFRLPNHLISFVPGRLPGGRRDAVRMMVVDRSNSTIEHGRFHDLEALLRAGDVLVVNDSLVLQDELAGRGPGGRPMTLILCGHAVDGWHVLVRPARRARRGAVVDIGGGAMRAVLLSPSLDDLWLARFEHDGDFVPLLERFGRRSAKQHRNMKDKSERFRSVYGTKPGSLEIPSAGLHFTTELLDRLRAKGVDVAAITLHIGLTELSQYRNIKTKRIEEHEVPAEWYEVTAAASRAILAARRRGGRVVAVGTTVVRTLEATKARPGSGWTDLYIHPGYRFKIVDAMLTNLHQPRSSHLAMVAAFAGKELTLAAYRELVRRRYRFDIFGDSMLIT